jgi:hypothetical protein
MLYSEIIAVCSQIHTKHINTLCGQNVELLNVVHVVEALCWKHENSPKICVLRTEACGNSLTMLCL